MCVGGGGDAVPLKTLRITKRFMLSSFGTASLIYVKGKLNVVQAPFMQPGRLSRVVNVSGVLL